MIMRQPAVFVVDDDQVNLLLMQREVSKLGLLSAAFTDGEYAIQAYWKHMEIDNCFKVGIIDLHMRKPGTEIAAEILSLDPNAKLVLCSSSKEDPVVQNFEQYGFRAVIYAIGDLAIVIPKLLKEG